MSSVNRVTLLGNVGKEPEVRYSSNGDAIATFSIATSQKWTDKATGERKEQTEWHRVTAFKRLAEVVKDYVSKGSKVYVEGSLNTRKWTDKDGIERYTTEVRANELVLLGGGGGEERPRSAPKKADAAESGFDEFSDEIPF